MTVVALGASPAWALAALGLACATLAITSLGLSAGRPRRVGDPQPATARSRRPRDRHGSPTPRGDGVHHRGVRRARWTALRSGLRGRGARASRRRCRVGDDHGRRRRADRVAGDDAPPSTSPSGDHRAGRARRHRVGARRDGARIVGRSCSAAPSPSASSMPRCSSGCSRRAASTARQPCGRPSSRSPPAPSSPPPRSAPSPPASSSTEGPPAPASPSSASCTSSPLPSECWTGGRGRSNTPMAPNTRMGRSGLAR